MISSSRLPVVVLFLASIIWGLTWLPLKFIHQTGIDGIALVFVSHALLNLVLLAARPSWHLFILYRRPLLGIAIAGGTAVTCFTYALIHGDVIRVMVLFYLVPVWGVVGGRIFLGERIDLMRTVCVVLALLGAFLILGGNRVFSSPPVWTDFLALMAGVAFAANNLFFRAVHQVGLTTKLTAMFWGCMLLALSLLIFGVEPMPVDIGLTPWLWVAAYSVTFLLLANLGSQWGVSHLEAGRASVIMIMELVAAVVSALWIGGEQLSGMEWLGAFFVVASALLEASRRPVVAQAPM